jgi:hypothetical protein
MGKAAVWLAAAGVILFGGTNAGAETHGAGSGAAMPAMYGMRTISPPEQLPVPIRMAGIGNSHITIKANAEAQTWFDQGLSLLHDFWDYESAKAFEQAIRTDPTCAMGYWGLAQAEGMRSGPKKIYGDRALSGGATEWQREQARPTLH